ncbi:GIY-YIG nuclease family protein [Clostridium sp.]|uniref:GIY-YIG nuclease family protein n=1 Tax=Clostridium sp. TaxID=1506 RepID=UPI003216A3D3
MKSHKEINESKKYIVYMHENNINKKRYIGITSIGLNARCGKNGQVYKQCTYFWNAIQKYGWENFKHITLLENLQKEEACKKEVELISKYNTRDSNHGYNILKGGTSGRSGLNYSEEEKLQRTGKNNPVSKYVICITTNMIFESISLAAKYYNLERKNISRSCIKGYSCGVYDNQKLYLAYCDEHGNYIEINHPKQTRKVKCITTNKSFESIKESSEYYKICQDSIWCCCNGKAKSGGKLNDKTRLVWQYI